MRALTRDHRTRAWTPLALMGEGHRAMLRARDASVPAFGYHARGLIWGPPSDPGAFWWARLHLALGHLSREQIAALVRTGDR